METNIVNCIPEIMPLLSICIPTYNRSKQVDRQLKDILKQSKDYLGNRVEVIVSNNASTDDTDIKIKNIYNKEPTFKYILQPNNIGAEKNFAFLVNKAKGKFFWCVGDDDVIRPGTVTYIVNILSKWTDLGAIFLKCGGARCISEKYIIWNKINSFKISKSNIYSYTPDILKIFPFPEDGSGDWMFITKCILRKEAYQSIINDNEFFKNKASTLFASCLSVHNCTFYYDCTIGCIVGGFAENNWHEYANDVCLDILNGINKLYKFGFSEYEKECLMLCAEPHIYYISLLGSVAKNKTFQEGINYCKKYNQQDDLIIFYNIIDKLISTHKIALLGNVVKNIQKHKLPLSIYYDRKYELKQYGVSISLFREVIWYFKYIFNYIIKG